MRLFTLPGTFIRYIIKRIKILLRFALAEPIQRTVDNLDELSIVDETLEKLPKGYFVLNNYFCLTQSIDYIIIGPPGVFVICVMNHRGTMEKMGDDLLINSRRPPKNFITMIKRQMDELHTVFLEKCEGDWPISPIICFIHAYIKTKGKIRGVAMTPVWGLLREIKERPIVFDESEVLTITRALRKCSTSAPQLHPADLLMVRKYKQHHEELPKTSKKDALDFKPKGGP